MMNICIEPSQNDTQLRQQFIITKLSIIERKNIIRKKQNRVKHQKIKTNAKQTIKHPGRERERREVKRRQARQQNTTNKNRSSSSAYKSCMEMHEWMGDDQKSVNVRALGCLEWQGAIVLVCKVGVKGSRKQTGEKH